MEQHPNFSPGNFVTRKDSWVWACNQGQLGQFGDGCSLRAVRILHKPNGGLPTFFSLVNTEVLRRAEDGHFLIMNFFCQAGRFSCYPVGNSLR